MSSSIEIAYASARNRRLGHRSINLLLGLATCVFLGACDRGSRQTVQNSTVKPSLSAEPNPIPAGDPNQPLGTTVITWNTGNGTTGYIYVKIDREPEKFVTQGSLGTYEVPWIQFDSFYEFRLYAKKRSKLLAKLEVTRDD
jgi:hypothetical protein